MLSNSHIFSSRPKVVKFPSQLCQRLSYALQLCVTNANHARKGMERRGKYMKGIWLSEPEHHDFPPFDFSPLSKNLVVSRLKCGYFLSLPSRTCLIIATRWTSLWIIRGWNNSNISFPKDSTLYSKDLHFDIPVSSSVFNCDLNH